MPSINIAHALLLFIISKLSDGNRRIVNGKQTVTPKRYMVYLLKAPNSLQQYDNWLCGGAIVSADYIVTSAACIEDVKYMYAISGYDKYVPNVDADECTKNTHKKIIFTCVPKPYEFDYNQVEKWAYIDIGVARVESPFDFEDTSNIYRTHCTWIPSTININYEAKHQGSDKDAYVVGWGSKEKMRQPNDTTNNNQPMLQYASTKIYDMEECIKAYEDYPGIKPLIEKYMICTMNDGNIDESGDIIQKDDRVDGCGDDDKGKPVSLLDDTPYLETSDDDAIILLDETRRNMSDTLNVSATLHSPRSNKYNFSNSYNNTMIEYNRSKNNYSTNLRRQGICQNDHGGPLVSWVGAHEVLLGVASVFMIDKDFMCKGPYLYTSTYCTGLFLDCILSNNTRRNSKCDLLPQEKGFHLIERTISWVNHPAGPAANEIKRRPVDEIQIRPQRPLHNL